MTATQAPPATTSPGASPGLAQQPISGLAGILGTADHKVVGRLYLGSALLFGLASVVTGLLGGLDRIDGTLGDTVLDEGSVAQVASFHTTSAVLLFLIPALLGLAMVVVPLQVGARAIAFPRAAAASYWAFLIGASITCVAYAINGGPGGGRSEAVDLWAAASILVVGALVLGSICVATTILAVRTRGMDLDRVPMFTWSLLCTTVVWILTLPVLAAVLVVMYVDHRYGQVFLGGGGPAMADRLAWIGRPPQVYGLTIPLLGIALDAVAVASGRRLPNRTAGQILIGAFAALSVGAFALAAVSPEAADQPVTKGMALLAPLPVLGILGLVGIALKAGKPKVTSGLVGGALGLLLLVVATLMGAAVPFEWVLHLGGTQWEVGQAHLTLVAAVVGLVTALYHWSTKVVGRAGNEAAGRTALLVLSLGGVALALPEAISGLAGDGAEAIIGIEAMNTAALVGAGIVVLGALLAVAGLVGRRRDDEPSDPWGGQTLEWATASPPSFANFDGDVPAVTSAEPLLSGDADDEEASA